MNLNGVAPYPDNNPKTKFGLTKPQMSLTPSTALVHLAGAFADGAAKYGPYNWREKKVSSTVCVDAMLRHIADWFDGENNAPDSGVHHLAHVMACCAIIIDAETVGNLNDNRPPKAPTAELIRAMTKGGLVTQADLDTLEARLRKKVQQVETARLTPAGPTVYGTHPFAVCEVSKDYRPGLFQIDPESCECSCCQDARAGFHGGGPVDELQWPLPVEESEGPL